jgi:hypothetical protein
MDPPNGIPPRPLGRPIKPSEVVNLKCQYIPEIVFNIFNDHIASAWDGRKAIVRQEQVVSALLDTEKYTREEIFRKHILDIEEIYRREGWKIEFDKPGYGESYGAFWTFTKA